MQAVLVVAPVFILVVLGWLLRQRNWLSSQTIKENTFFLYWIALPCTLVSGILKADVSEVKNVSFAAAVWLPHIITLIIVWVMVRGKEINEQFATIMLCATRNNNFFAGLPVVALAMGQRGTEAGTLILAFSMAVMQLFSIVGAQLALFGTVTRKTIRDTCIQLLKNPIFLSCVVGLSLVTTGLNSLPPWLDATMSILADISTGLALVMVGAEIRLQSFFKNAVSVWKLVLFKLTLFPAVTYLIYICFGLSQDMVQAGVLLSGMPVAVSGVLIAQEMGMDADYCVMGVTITTLISLLTLPVLIHLLGLA